MSEDGTKLRPTLSESGFSLEVRDEINDKLQDTFENLVDYKIQALKQAKTMDDQQKIIEKYKTKCERMRSDIIERRNNMNAILNLFDVTDQITIDDLKKIVQLWKIHDSLYAAIAHVFGEKPQSNKDFSNQIVEMQRIIGSLETLLPERKSSIVDCVQQLINKNNEVINRQDSISKILSAAPEDLVSNISYIVQTKKSLEQTNEKQKNELEKITKERNQLAALKRTIMTQLNAKDDEMIVPTIEKLINGDKILQNVTQKLGCDIGSTEVQTHSLLSKVKMLESEKDAIATALGVKNTTLVASVRDLVDYKKRLESEANDFKSENEKLRAKLLQTESQNRTYLDTIRQRGTKIDSLTKEREQLQAQLQALQDQLAALTQSYEESQAQLTTVTGKLQQNENLKQMLQKEFDSSQKHSVTVVEKLAADNTAKANEINKLNVDLAASTRMQGQLQEKIKQVETQKQSAQVELDMLRKKNEQLQADNTKKIDEISQLKTQIESLTRKNDETVTHLQQTLGSYRLLQSEFDSARKTSEEALAKASEEISENAKEINSLKTDILAAQRLHETDDTTIQMLQNEITANKQHSTEVIEKLKQESAQKTGEIASLNANIDNAKRTVDEIQQRLDKNNANIKLMQAQNEAEKKRYLEETTELINDNAEKQKEIASLKAKLSTAEREKAELVTNVDTLSTQIEQNEALQQLIQKEYEAARQHSHAVLEKVTNESSEKSKEIAQLKVDLKDVTDKLQEAEVELESLRSALSSQESETTAQAQREIVALKKSLSLKDQTIAKLNEEINEINDSSHSLVVEQASDLQKMSNRASQLVDQLTKVKTELEISKGEQAKLQSEIKKNEATIAAQNKTLTQQNTTIVSNTQELAQLHSEIGQLKLKHEQTVASLQKERQREIAELKAEHIKEIATASESSQREINRISLDTQQKLDDFIVQSRELLTQKQNEILELAEKHQQEISQITAEKAAIESNYKDKEAELNRQINSLVMENNQLRDKISTIGEQIHETSKELNAVQNDFNNRTKIFDQSLASHREALEQICDILGLKKSSTADEVIESVDRLMKNFAKQQIEVCKSLKIPRGSPIKDIKKRILDLQETNESYASVADHLGLPLEPKAIQERVENLEQIILNLQNQVKQKEQVMRDIADELNVSKTTQIHQRIQELKDEKFHIQTELENTAVFNKTLCETLGCDDADLDKTIEDAFKSKKQLERAHNKLAELVGLQPEKHITQESVSVVYERVSNLKKTRDQLSQILGTERIEDSVLSLKRQNDDLIELFDAKGEDDSVVYAANLTKRTLQNVSQEKDQIIQQQSKLCEMLNVSSFNDLQRTVAHLKEDNDRLQKANAANAILREQVAEIIDEGGLDSTQNDSIVTALRQMKLDRSNMSTTLKDQTKLLSAALGIKGRTQEAMAKGILNLRKKCKENDDIIQRMNEMLFGICRMLKIEYTSDKTTFGEIELAIGSLLSSNELLKDRVGEVVGLSPSLRDAQTISKEVKKLYDTAKDVERMRKLVGELEGSKQELQRMCYRPKTTATTQTEPLENESLPIIQEQASTIRDFESQLRTQERELGRNHEEIDILRSSLTDIYQSLGAHVLTPREAIREIGHLKMQNEDLSRSVIESQQVQITPSALTDFQQAQMANLRAQSDRLYHQAKTLKNDASAQRLHQATSMSMASQSYTGRPSATHQSSASAYSPRPSRSNVSASSLTQTHLSASRNSSFSQRGDRYNSPTRERVTNVSTSRKSSFV